MAKFELTALTPETAIKFGSPEPQTSSAILDHEQKVAIPFPASLETITGMVAQLEERGDTLAEALSGCFVMPGLYDAVVADNAASNG